MATNDSTPLNVLYVGTYGPEDPTRATLVFAAAIAISGKGRDVNVALLGQGALLMDDNVAKGMRVVGRRADRDRPQTIFDLMAKARKAGVKIHC